MNSSVRRILITGSNRGLGYELAKDLIKDPNYIIMMSFRSIEKGLESRKRLLELNPVAKIEYKQLDQSDKNSIDRFINEVSSENIKFDVIVHNAAINIDSQKSLIENAHLLVQTNFLGIIDLNQKIMPFLTHDAKIILISSEFAELRFQGESIQEKLNQQRTKDELIKLSEDYLEMVKDDQLVGWKKQIRDVGKYENTSYYATKALITSYFRHVVTNQVNSDQNVFVVNPGWCKTDMGSEYAKYEVEQGIQTSKYLIQQVGYGRSEYHGKFLNEHGQVQSY